MSLEVLQKTAEGLGKEIEGLESQILLAEATLKELYLQHELKKTDKESIDKMLVGGKDA